MCMRSEGESNSFAEGKPCRLTSSRQVRHEFPREDHPDVFPAGDLRGIRIAEITTRIVQVIEVPRSLLSDFLAMHESLQVAVYFLVGATQDEVEPKAYVGQTGNLAARLASHVNLKKLWERALVVVSRTNSLT